MKVKSFLEKYGSWALVTGASDGIGRAFAFELAGKGFNLVLVARRKELLESVKRELLERHNLGLILIDADLGTEGGVARVLLETENLEIGLFIGAAGFGTSGDFINNELSEELSMIDLNCRSVVEQTHNFVRRFKAQGRGGIILFGSLVGFQGTPRAANYAATKGFIQVFAEGLRVEMKRYGVDVLAVSPGPVNSGFSARANMHMGNVDKPEAVARAALAALGKRATVRPGFLGKLLGYSMCLTPRPIRVMIMTRVMGNMTRHNHRDLTK